MTRIIFIFFCLVSTTLCFSQTFEPTIFKTKYLSEFSNKIINDKSIDAVQAISLLSSYNTYPKIKKTGIEYLFFYEDAYYGKVPIRVYIPKNYDNKKPNPLILHLHGASGRGKFTDVDTKLMKYVSPDSIDFTNDYFVDYIKQDDNYILVRPITDWDTKFNWSVNKSGLSSTPTIKTISEAVVYLKTFLNVDDNRLYSLGHSDGSDGTFGMAVFKPTLFAGFVGYNSMLTQLFGQVYLQNLRNKPFYLVHSDLDDLRPIFTARNQVKILDSLKAPIYYKEYIGYNHDDKHLNIDAPNAHQFIKSIIRNPYPQNIYWETDNELFNQSDWLIIKTISTKNEPLSWHTNINFREYNKIEKKYSDYDYYNFNKTSGAVMAKYLNNKFNISASNIDEIELLISPMMVNLENPIVVEVNGKIVFNQKIEADKSFLLAKFNETHDRKAFWVNSITIKTY